MTGGIQGFIDANSAVIGLVILAAMFVEFLRERYPVAVVSLLGACAFVVTGLLEPDGFYSVFSNSAPLAIGAMFVLSGALVRTGAIDRSEAHKSEIKSLMRISSAVFCL